MPASPNRVAALLVGTGMVVLGIAGIASTAAHPASRGEVFGVFAANLPQAIVHLLLGVGLGIAALASRRTARIGCQVGGTLLLALGVAGLFLVDTGANVLALGASDNLAHFSCAAVLLIVGFGAERTSASA